VRRGESWTQQVYTNEMGGSNVVADSSEALTGSASWRGLLPVSVGGSGAAVPRSWLGFATMADG
jgi:hypothetical protein